MRILPIVVAFSWLIFTAGAEEEREIEELEQLMESYQRKIAADVDAGYEAALADLKRKYIASLEGAVEAAQKDGQLEKAVAFKNEIKRVESSPEERADPSGSEPSRLTALRAVYDRNMKRFESEREIRRAPIDRQLLVQLSRLKQSLTREGRLEDALRVKEKRDEVLERTERRDAISEERLPSDPEAELLSWLQDHELYWSATKTDRVTLRFEEDQVIVYADEREVLETGVEIQSDLVFTFPWNGRLNTITLDRSRRSFLRKWPGGGHRGQVQRARR